MLVLFGSPVSSAFPVYSLLHTAHAIDARLTVSRHIPHFQGFVIFSFPRKYANFLEMRREYEFSLYANSYLSRGKHVIITFALRVSKELTKQY